MITSNVVLCGAVCGAVCGDGISELFYYCGAVCELLYYLVLCVVLLCGFNINELLFVITIKVVHVSLLCVWYCVWCYSIVVLVMWCFVLMITSIVMVLMKITY
jgi:hypothetical protein